jgi:cysteine desulfurase/selenocysteine lyase
LLGIPASARASLYVYNIPDDIDALVAALHDARRVFGLA